VVKLLATQSNFAAEVLRLFEQGVSAKLEKFVRILVTGSS
jgi:hypothetical protein